MPSWSFPAPADSRNDPRLRLVRRQQHDHSEAHMICRHSVHGRGRQAGRPYSSFGWGRPAGRPYSSFGQSEALFNGSDSSKRPDSTTHARTHARSVQQWTAAEVLISSAAAHAGLMPPLPPLSPLPPLPPLPPLSRVCLRHRHFQPRRRHDHRLCPRRPRPVTDPVTDPAGSVATAAADTTTASQGRLAGPETGTG